MNPTETRVEAPPPRANGQYSPGALRKPMKPGPKTGESLLDLRALALEQAKTYFAIKRGRVDSREGLRRTMVLASISKTVEAMETLALSERLAALEEALALRAGKLPVTITHKAAA